MTLKIWLCLIDKEESINIKDPKKTKLSSGWQAPCSTGFPH